MTLRKIYSVLVAVGRQQQFVVCVQELELAIEVVRGKAAWLSSSSHTFTAGMMPWKAVGQCPMRDSHCATVLLHQGAGVPCFPYPCLKLMLICFAASSTGCANITMDVCRQHADALHISDAEQLYSTAQH